MTNQTRQVAAPLGEVTPPFVESMVSRIAANPLLIEELSALLTSKHFYKPEEQHLAVMYDAMVSVYQRHHMLQYETVRAEIVTLLCDRPLPEALAEHLLEEPNGLLCWCLENGVERIRQAPIEQSREMIRRFLHERSVFLPLQVAVQQGIPQDIQAVLDTAQRQNQLIGQLDTDPVSGGIPDGRGNMPLVIRSTGIAFMDRFMDGGMAAGEAYGLLGPTGVGKTAHACAMAGAALLEESLRFSEDPAYQTKKVYYATYEAGKDEIRQRIISSMAEIARETVKHIDFSLIGDPPCLSSMGLQNYKAYELGRSVEAGQPRLGELERYLNIKSHLEHNLRIIDMSGLGDQRYCRPGIGGIQELIGVLTTDQARLGNPGIAVVFVDYLLLMAERYLQSKGMDPLKHNRSVLPEFVDAGRMQIASRFNTSVWFLQQFNTTGNKKSPTATMSLSDAAEAGARFAHNLSFCAALGTKDPQTNCTLLTFPKRRRDGGVQPERILMIDPIYHRLVDVTEHYMVDRHRGQILPRAFASQIRGQTAVQAQRPVANNDLIGAL